MFFKKRLNTLEKRIADLERQLADRPKEVQLRFDPRKVQNEMPLYTGVLKFPQVSVETLAG